jgi:hypothetical protein
LLRNSNLRNGGLNQILKRQTSRFHYGSKVPVETLCFVFFKLLGTELSNIYYEKNKKYYIFGTVPKSNRKIGDRGKIDTPNT